MGENDSFLGKTDGIKIAIGSIITTRTLTSLYGWHLHIYPYNDSCDITKKAKVDSLSYDGWLDVILSLITISLCIEIKQNMKLLARSYWFLWKTWPLDNLVSSTMIASKEKLQDRWWVVV